MLTVQINWQSLAINAAIVWASTTLASYFIITAYERISELKINRRIKALLPVALAMVGYFFIGRGEWWLKLALGFVVGTAATSLYQWFVDKFLEAIDGVYHAIVDSIKAKIAGLIK